MAGPAAIALLVGTSLQLSSEEPSGQPSLRDFLAVALHGWSMVNGQQACPSQPAHLAQTGDRLWLSLAYITQALWNLHGDAVCNFLVSLSRFKREGAWGSDLILAHGALLAHSGSN